MVFFHGWVHILAALHVRDGRERDEVLKHQLKTARDLFLHKVSFRAQHGMKRDARSDEWKPINLSLYLQENLIIYPLGLHGSLEYVSGIPPGICCSKVKGRAFYPNKRLVVYKSEGKLWRLCFCSFAKLASGFLASSELTVISVIICRDSGKKVKRNQLENEKRRW